MTMKNNNRVAFIYDFDGTLAKGNIQENSFIPEIGMTNEQFWGEAKKLAEDNDMNEILAYMYLMIKKARESPKKVSINKNSIKKHGKTVQYFSGVEEYFDRINQYAKEKGIKLEHYIISSGTKEMIEGCSIYKHFKYVYASSYMYDADDIPQWPALAIDYTAKTQFLFRINKGIENAWDNTEINKYIPEEERPLPFSRMVYLGDGSTDIPAMKMINYQGGNSIAVYPPNKRDAKKKIKDSIVQGNRSTYIAKADYCENSELYNILKSIIDRISALNRVRKNETRNFT